MAIDKDKLMRVPRPGSSATSAPRSAAGNVVVGDRLGLYRALAGRPGDAEELAARDRHRPALRRRVAARPGGGRLRRVRPGDRRRYSLTEEQAFALTDPDGPVYLPGAFELALGALQGRAADRGGVPHRGRASAGTSTTTDVFAGCERFFRPGLPRQPGPELDPGPRRRRGQAAGRAPRWPTSAAGTAPRPC